ncbi:MAG: hypothetical protein MJ071_07285 [Oscillospiraceae bacterium]|nr:hypothetical protein [Oscillospiraceae bacterium]
MAYDFYSKIVKFKDRGLSKEEQRYVSSAECSLWQPLPYEFLALVRKDAALYTPSWLSPFVLSIAACAVSMVMGFYMVADGKRRPRYGSRRRYVPMKTIVIASIIIGIITFLSTMSKKIFLPDFRKIDASAGYKLVYLKDAFNISRDGHKIAFYLEDGKYILESDGTPFPDEILLIRYQNHHIWYKNSY